MAQTDIAGSCNILIFLFWFSEQHLDDRTLGHNSSRLYSCFSAVDILAAGVSHFCTRDKRDLLVLLAAKYETIPLRIDASIGPIHFASQAHLRSITSLLAPTCLQLDAFH